MAARPGALGPAPSTVKSRSSMSLVRRASSVSANAAATPTSAEKPELEAAGLVMPPGRPAGQLAGAEPRDAAVVDGREPLARFR